jgi:hypothetical protein
MLAFKDSGRLMIQFKIQRSRFGDVTVFENRQL